MICVEHHFTVALFEMRLLVLLLLLLESSRQMVMLCAMLMLLLLFEKGDVKFWWGSPDCPFGLNLRFFDGAIVLVSSL